MRLNEYLKSKESITGIILFSYFRSSSSWWIRAQLDLKQIPYTLVTVNLSSGEHLSEEYERINPFK